MRKSKIELWRIACPPHHFNDLAEAVGSPMKLRLCACSSFFNRPAASCNVKERPFMAAVSAFATDAGADVEERRFSAAFSPNYDSGL